ncbi:MAG: glycosyltransferase N-terminal domain-containing protein [Bacteroidales bacterium]|nr:glycosyltransferase N-terminal domain-containing protein [Bacteroidales bacterium]
MYSFFIHIYALAVRIAAFRIKKARLMLRGHKQTFPLLKERLEKDTPYIWVHVSSLGEFEQGRPVMEAIRESYPNAKILLTFFSPSGYEVRKNYPGADIICYLPFDTEKNATRFVELVNPKIVIFIKYDLWPNYLNAVAARNIPAYLVSAIFRKSQLFFKPYGKWYRSVLTCFSRIFVQDETSVELLKSIQINHVEKCGDTRFDRVKAICRQAKSLPLVEAFLNDDSFVIVAGSTWPADEDLILPYFLNNKNIKLILAPHEIHEEHLKFIEDQIGPSSIRYSQYTGINKDECRCLIMDCFGLLSSVYRYGNIAYIGGGFGVGIHNILEAAVYGLPIVFGPNFKRFKESRDLIDLEGARSIKDAASFSCLLDDWQKNSFTREQTGKKAAEFVQNQSGATACIMKVITNEVKL